MTAAGADGADEKKQSEALALLHGTPAGEEAEEALLRLKAATLLEDLYDARLRLLESFAALKREMGAEKARLEQQAQIFIRSVESARRLGAAGADSPLHSTQPVQPEENAAAPAAPEETSRLSLPQESDPYAGFLTAARGRLDAAEQALSARETAAAEVFRNSLSEAEARIREQVRGLLKNHAPRVGLTLQPVGRENAVAWIDRPSPDDAVLLYALLSGCLPTRYDALFNDAVDDPALEAPTFFEEDGFPARPSLDEGDELSVRPAESFVPFKAHIPFRLPGQDFPRFRLLNQGPVIQLLARERGQSYAPLMSLETAESACGLFIRLQVEGKIALEFSAL